MSYLTTTNVNMKHIVDFVAQAHPDVAGLVEIDTGSIRTRSANQVDAIASALGHTSSYRTKYGTHSFTKHVPILRGQGNAFITGYPIGNDHAHYFNIGIKRLVLELELDEVCFYLVHLSLKYLHRHQQLRQLRALIDNTNKPLIVAGDFNTLRGDYELEPFMAETGLKSANAGGAPSYPSRAPRKQLDFILYSHQIRMQNFEMPQVAWSDHLPLICDFDIPPKPSEPATTMRVSE